MNKIKSLNKIKKAQEVSALEREYERRSKKSDKYRFATKLMCIISIFLFFLGLINLNDSPLVTFYWTLIGLVSLNSANIYDNARSIANIRLRMIIRRLREL